MKGTFYKIKLINAIYFLINTFNMFKQRNKKMKS